MNRRKLLKTVSVLNTMLTREYRMGTLFFGGVSGRLSLHYQQLWLLFQVCLYGQWAIRV
jgi:hypothetical protein